MRPAITIPDAHWGYGFPIGGVAAFDAEQGGVISAGGVGFDISCGICCLRRNLNRLSLVVGSMGTGSYILAGSSNNPAFASAFHGAGRVMSQRQAMKHWYGRTLTDEIAHQGI